DRAAAKNHFAISCQHTGHPLLINVLHSPSPVATKHNPADQRIGHDAEVLPAPGGIEKRPRRTPAPPLLLGYLKTTKSALIFTIEIIVTLLTKLLTGTYEDLGQRVRVLHSRNIQWPAPTMPGIRRILLVVFMGNEYRPHRLPVPSCCPGIFPAIVILMLPADVHHGIDRATSTGGFPSWPVKLPVPRGFLGGRVIAPVALALFDQP